MSNKEELKITMNEKTWEPKGIIGSYLGLCMGGIGAGAVVGGYIGAAVGFTGALLSPALVGYGLVRVGRKILRR